ncbi:hypothetical protein [Nonomuraea dietziae]|uniref:hypothetical protein n=1 Tax=Nonomuraea dietziae TaxID=65515 RepID=UPI0031D0D7AB
MTAESPNSADPITALLIACDRFHSHVTLLADQLRDVELGDEDAERVHEAVHRTFTTVGLVGSLTVGLQRDADEAECPHYNVLSDAEWARLSVDLGAHERKLAYECELQPGHPGPHLSLAQSFADRDTWLRWVDRGVRKLVDLPPCLAEDGPVDDPERCLLFDGHPGKHSFDPDVVEFGREASPEMQHRMDDLFGG